MKHTKLLIVLLWLALAVAFAQTGGQISGVVNDPSGALVPNANITVTNTATNVVRTTETNASGLYVFPDLPPGVYDVKAVMAGFDTVTKAGVEIQVQATVRVDFALSVGQSTQTIEVAANGALLSTENATVGTVIEEQRIMDLPLNGRSFFSLVALSPNVTFGFSAAAQASSRLGGTRSSLTMALTGARATWSNYTLDGITNTDIDFNTYILQPSVDALQEFKVQSGIYPAEFGREAGQVNVSTKPGTNEYHGTASEFLRNNVLDARPYDFVSATRSATNPSPKSAPYRQNQYGFTLGGPVRIPKLFNGKNRLFFMTNFEGYNSRKTTPTLTTVLTGPMRTGDFSGLPAAYALADPNSRVVTTNASGTVTGVTQSMFPNNQIPLSRLSAASTLLSSKWEPLPNQPAAAGTVPYQNYQFGLKVPVDKDTFTQRIDFNESSKSQWFGRYSWNDESTLAQNPSLGLNDGNTLYTRASQWVLSNVRTLSATKVNEARFGYNSMFNNITQQLASIENVDAEIGMPVQVTDKNSWGIPNIGLNANNLTGFGNPTSSPFEINDKYYEWVDNFSWVIGKHSLRFGGEYRYNQFPQTGNEFPRGQFYFDTQFTNSYSPTNLSGSGGYTGADFMLGDTYNAIVAVSLASANFTNNEWASYIDDTWRVAPRLTLSLGLRWEVAQPLLDTSGHEVNVEINQPLPNQADVPNLAVHPTYVRTGSGSFYDGINFVYEPYWASVSGGAAASGSPPLRTVREDAPNARLINTNYKNFAPRIGVAYSPSDKWSVRTGIGMFYSQESKNSIFDMNRGLGGRTGNVASPAYLPPTFTYSNFINTAALPVTLPVGLTWGANPHLPTTYSMQYLLNIQRTLGKSTTLEVGYNGSQSRHLDHLINQNQPVLNASLPYVSRLPYPEFGASGIQWLNADSNGNYNGMSAKLTQRLGNNLNTLIAYTWSRSLDDSSAIRGTGNDFSPENALCPNSCEYGPSAFNVKHRFVASILYSLPFGKGMKFLNHGGVVNEVVGGWQFSTIATLQSGIPTETTSWDSGQTDAVPPSSRLNCTGLSPTMSNPSQFGWFNSAAFSNPLAGTFGNCGRNDLVDPHQVNIDFSTIKFFQIAERKNLEFRMEMFNAPNHVELGGPNVSWNSATGQTPAPSNFGWITSLVSGATMREIQFALKFNF